MKSFPAFQGVSRLRYLEFEGRGPPTLIIHGLNCASSFDYPHVVTSAALSERHFVLLDLLGFGYSDRPDDFGYGISDHAAVLAEFVQARGFGTVNLFGHSMGGAIAIEVACLLGSQVGNLVLAEGNLDRGGGALSRPIAAMDPETYVRTGHDRLISQSIAEGDDLWAATMRSAFPMASYLGARSLVEGGSTDWRRRFLLHPSRKAFIFGQWSLPDPDAEILAEAGVQVLVVPDAGHAMALGNPAGLAEAIAAALD